MLFGMESPFMKPRTGNVQPPSEQSYRTTLYILPRCRLFFCSALLHWEWRYGLNVCICNTPPRIHMLKS